MSTRLANPQRKIPDGRWGLVLLLLLISCSGKGTGPSRSSSVIRATYVNTCSTLVTYEGDSKIPRIVYSAADSWSIGSFCHSTTPVADYLVLLRTDSVQELLTTSLVRLQSDGTTVELHRLSACSDCEGYHSFGEIHLSSDGRYLAIDVRGWEWGDMAVFDLTENRFVQFDCGRGSDYTGFLMWYPAKNLLYGYSGNALIEYDVDVSHCRELPTPNIRDYVSEAELLTQGYVGERVDYKALTGNRWPPFINWHPSGWYFAYEWNDSLYLFNMRDSTAVLLYGGNFDCYAPHFGVEWDTSGGSVPPPRFGDRDIIAPLDSSILDTVAPLNDSINYAIGRSGTTSYLECSWGSDVQYSRYIFRGSATAEKFHIAELDYLLSEFNFNLTPRFLFLTTNYEGWYLTDYAYASRYQQMVREYWVALQMFRDFRYPDVLAGNAERYLDLFGRDYRFEAAMAAYIVNRDPRAFVDTVKVLSQGMSVPFADTIATWLEGFQSGDRSKITSVYITLHNRYLNFYGRVIARDFDDALDAHLIERFYGDM